MSMTIAQRLRGLQKWLYVNACKGRKMKAMGKNDLDIVYREPYVKLLLFTDAEAVPEVPKQGAPCILILVKESGMRDMEQRFDRYKGINRPKPMAGMLSFQLVFVTYDPGHRTEKSQADQTYADVFSNEEEAYLAVLDWAEETMNSLIELGSVPGTDLMIDPVDIRCGPMMQYGVLLDRRPLYYGVVDGVFGCQARMISNQQVNILLD